ncbi:Do family serine endopeptidase [Providencia burhodogranariea]|uniref:Protease DegQ n=1 Tax=Providencia burhodogranariea DSM 19968 TaxID=1141662 RepID=K8WQ94_9GAMM|nr:Do family serine endopeptidase [Providencia burhodogranariea]EKT59642.1 protease precursor DegQ [Providencia burhodogranariea DSM 19968]
MKRKSFFLTAAALSLGLSLSVLPSISSAALPATLPASAQSQNLPSLAPMLEKVLPAVVSIHVSGTRVQNQQIPEELKFFFGPNLPQQQSTRPFEGLGSGVIIDAVQGYILTNNHVIDGADKIQIQLNDGREIEVKLIGKDAQTDIALLKITNDKDIKNLTAVSIADSDKLRVGDFAVAVGNPFGLGQTATSGIISALGRSGLNLEGLENFIQTDASINRGNSGGALVNLNGELIGINTAILAPGGGNIGIGFAIPSNMAKNLSEQLIKNGEVKRGILGITGKNLTSDIAKVFNANIQRGAFVSAVLPKSSAAKAGIKAGDIIVSVDGKPLNSFAELRAKIGTSQIGKEITIGLIRSGKPLDVKVVLENDEGEATRAEKLSEYLLGATLSNATISNTKGVQIDSVAPKSPAAATGLAKGDLIFGVNDIRVENIDQFRKVIDAKPPVLAMKVLRGNETLYLLMKN